MSIPIFSYIYVLILVYFFVLSSNFKCLYVYNLILLLALEIIWPQGYAFQLGSTDYTVCGIQMCMVSIISIIYFIFIQKKLHNKLISVGAILLIIVLLGNFYQSLFPYDGYIMPIDMSWDDYVAGKIVLAKYEFSLETFCTGYMKLICYMLVVYVVKTFLNIEDIRYVVDKIICISFPVVLYGYVEMLLKNVLGMPQITYEITEFVFGLSQHTYGWENATMLEDDVYRLQGFTREPSHYVLSLLFFGILILIMMKSNKGIGKKIPLVYYTEILFIFLLMPMTGGMSAIWCIFSLIMVYTIININRSISIIRIIKWFVVISICVFSSVYGFYYLLDNDDIALLKRFSESLDTVSLMINNPGLLIIAGVDGSTLARFTSILVCMGNWLDNPLLGVGIGYTNAHDFIASILVKSGFIGFVIWYIFMTIRCNLLEKYDHLLILTVLWIVFLPMGPNAGWYTVFYFVLLFEATKLYANKL